MHNKPASAPSGGIAIPVRKPGRALWAIAGERTLEAVIRFCGISAILFVLAIFFFVFREALPVLFSEHFSLREFFFSTQWYPTSVSNVRYGTLALTVGTVSVTALAMQSRALGSRLFDRHPALTSLTAA